MPKFIQKYQCLFCGNLFSTEEKATEHENDCRYNPETKKCGTCKYLVYEYRYGVCDYTPKSFVDTYVFYDNNLTCPYHKLEEKETK